MFDKVQVNDEDGKFSADGVIVEVRFTEQKVFYDVLDTYHNIVLERIDSALVIDRG